VKFIDIFNNSRPNFIPDTIYLIATQLWELVTINLSVLGIVLLWEKPNSFSFFWLLVCFSFVCCLCSGSRPTTIKKKHSRPPKRGIYRQFITT
jgi:hypothetical protein